MRLLLDLIFPPRERALRARSLSPEDLQALVQLVRLACTDPPAVSLLPYRDPLVRMAVTEAKFNDAHVAQHALGMILAGYLSEISFEGPVVLAPIPLSRARMRERGYNQAERICRRALKQLDQSTSAQIHIDTSLLERIRDTKPQTLLGGAARRLNLQQAFQVSAPPDPHTLYIVMDDVITTGATLSAACEALKTAGARHMLPIALAHSP